jgi:hypothetical protein
MFLGRKVTKKALITQSLTAKKLNRSAPHMFKVWYTTV